MQIKKYSAVKATEEAPTAPADQNIQLNISGLFDMNIKLKEEKDSCEAGLEKMKAKYNEAKSV